jgi:hypothetical protein
VGQAEPVHSCKTLKYRTGRIVRGDPGRTAGEPLENSECNEADGEADPEAEPLRYARVGKGASKQGDRQRKQTPSRLVIMEMYRERRMKEPNNCLHDLSDLTNESEVGI